MCRYARYQAFIGERLARKLLVRRGRLSLVHTGDQLVALRSHLLQPTGVIELGKAKPKVYAGLSPSIWPLHTGFV